MKKYTVFLFLFSTLLTGCSMDSVRGFNDMSAQYVTNIGHFKILGHDGATTGNYTSADTITVRNESSQYCLARISWPGHSDSVVKFSPNEGRVWNRFDSPDSIASRCHSRKEVLNGDI